MVCIICTLVFVSIPTVSSSILLSSCACHRDLHSFPTRRSSDLHLSGAGSGAHGTEGVTEESEKEPESLGVELVERRQRTRAVGEDPLPGRGGLSGFGPGPVGEHPFGFAEIGRASGRGGGARCAGEGAVE